MLNHIMIGSNDIERSKAFYTQVLGVLGAGEPFVNVNDTGHTRLSTSMMARPFPSANRSMGKRPTAPMASPLGLNVIRSNR